MSLEEGSLPSFLPADKRFGLSPYYMLTARAEKIRLMAALSLINQVALSVCFDLPKPVFTAIKHNDHVPLGTEKKL